MANGRRNGPGQAGRSADLVARRLERKALSGGRGSERLLATAENYRQGAEGERIVARRLRRLPASKWTVLHDLKLDRNWNPTPEFTLVEHGSRRAGGRDRGERREWARWPHDRRATKGSVAGASEADQTR